jgi:hypothetical protein
LLLCNNSLKYFSLQLADVTDLGNQDPLENINLDFSLPFPSSRPPTAANIYTLSQLTSTTPGIPAAAPPAVLPADLPRRPAPEYDDFGMHEADYVSEEEPSVQEDVKPTRGRGRRANTRSRLATSKNTASAAAGGAKNAEPRNVTQQRKHQALQEKNRRAQRRFRERQKNRVTELEDQVALLNSQLATVVIERDALAQRNLELEAAANNNSVPALSDHQLGGKGVFNINEASLDSPQQQQPVMIATAAAPTSSADGCHCPSALCSQGMTLTPKLAASPVILTPSELCTMSQPVLSMHFGALVKECARTLVEGAGNPQSADRLSSLVDQALSLWHRVGHCNPTSAKQFATCSLDETNRGSPADERAPQIVRSLALIDRQKTDICSLRKLFLERVNTIAASRSAAVNQTTLSSNNSTTTTASTVYGGTSGRSLAMHQLAARQASHYIMNTLQEEHITAVEFETAVTKHVLAPAQAAQLLIHSFPWPPDCLSLTTWVAAESGDADALASLAAEAQARAAATAAAVAGSSVAVMVPVVDTSAIAAGRKTAGATAGWAGGSSMQTPFVLGNSSYPSALMAAAATAGATSSVNTCVIPPSRQRR